MHVLVCGLPETTASWLESSLGGLVVDTAAAGAMALALLRTQPYRLVVFEQSLPDMGAEEFASAVRETAGERVPLLFCCVRTTSSPEAARRLVSEHGVAQLLMHPLDPQELVEQTARHLGVTGRRTRAEPRGNAQARQAIEALWRRYQPLMLERVAALEAAAETPGPEGPGAEVWRHAAGEAHKLVGSLGIYGLPRGTELSREAERLLDDPAGGEPARERIGELARQLREEVERGPGAAVASRTGAPHLLVVEGDPGYAAELQATAERQGYEVSAVDNLSDARAALLRRRPSLVLLDLSLEEELGAGYALLRALSTMSPPVPVVVLAARRHLMERVQAARLGARIFLQKPVPAERVLLEASAVLQQLRSTRSRILAVDDDPEALSALRLLLEHEDLDVVTVEDPLDFWSVLEATSPDLLILDVDMPAVSGIELCRVVRNDPRWYTLPILFLTGRTDAATVHRVFSAGADDFVDKPVVGPELLTRIRNRLERSQLLRALSDLDGLTGIANRRRAAELLDQLHRLAYRQRQPLCFCLVDLDRFKRVNDEHGHRVGDQVLNAFADFLRESFRSEDVVGRWGGEEFVLGLYGIHRADAAERVGRALRAFAEREFVGADGTPFRVTASAGVSEFPRDGADMEALYRAADGALYRAKRGGRARVVEARAAAATDETGASA